MKDYTEETREEKDDRLVRFIMFGIACFLCGVAFAQFVWN